MEVELLFHKTFKWKTGSKPGVQACVGRTRPGWRPVTCGWWVQIRAQWNPDLRPSPLTGEEPQPADSASEVKRSGMCTAARPWPQSAEEESVKRQGFRTFQML